MSAAARGRATLKWICSIFSLVKVISQRVEENNPVNNFLQILCKTSKKYLYIAG